MIRKLGKTVCDLFNCVHFWDNFYVIEESAVNSLDREILIHIHSSLHL